jgi:hypothetical protein
MNCILQKPGANADDSSTAATEKATTALQGSLSTSLAADSVLEAGSTRAVQTEVDGGEYIHVHI